MFGISETELVLIVLFGFLLFGPDKLPGMGRTLGRALKQFRAAQEDFNEVVQSEVIKPMNEVMDATTAAEAKKQEAARKKALADDDDLDTDVAKSVPKRESFAERKRRLEAEKKAREEAAAVASHEASKGEEAAGEGAPAAAAASHEAQAPADAPTPEPAPANAPAATASATPAPASSSEDSTSAEDKPDLSARALYNLHPSRNSAATEDARKNYHPDMESAPVSAEAPKASPAAPEAPTTASPAPEAPAPANAQPQTPKEESSCR